MKSIYFSSKVKYAQSWIDWKDRGVNVISTWIYEADKGQSRDLPDLAQRCITEPSKADATILYCKQGEHLKFALAEVGAALAYGKIVFVIGDCESISSTMMHHPLIRKVESVPKALQQLGYNTDTLN